ncbi:MAG: hypothetical protein COV99_12665 [Bacteroidetes bacterium CG12_big_fil_rev_8_21_14_0_65_60_17]|nr:MAG: hypothetical protein COV99_12665 [Bacteroidetes bacterium CG12_big_fil_rev_8_21_14_0_65_60_17]
MRAANSMRIVRLLVLMALVPLAACDTAERQDDFVDDASAVPAGFARTGEDGEILEDDKDDWRTSPVYGGKVRFDPAFPNPTTGSLVTISLTVLEFGAIQGGLVLRGRDANGTLRTLDDLPEAAEPGVHAFLFSPSILARSGLVRVFVFDRVGEVVTYGDLFLE